MKTPITDIEEVSERNADFFFQKRICFSGTPAHYLKELLKSRGAIIHTTFCDDTQILVIENGFRTLTSKIETAIRKGLPILEVDEVNQLLKFNPPFQVLLGITLCKKAVLRSSLVFRTGSEDQTSCT